MAGNNKVQTGVKHAAVEGAVASTPARSLWRFRLLLLAVGSTTADGSDLTAADRELILGVELGLREIAARSGEAAADDALRSIVIMLEEEQAADGRAPAPGVRLTRH
jgi:hypothetical protein